MPPVRHANGHGSGKIIMKHGARKVLMRYPATYEAALTAARSEFKLTSVKPLELRVDMADVEPGSTRGAVGISAGSWDLLMDCERAPEVEVLESNAQQRSLSTSPSTSTSTPAPTSPSSAPVQSRGAEAAAPQVKLPPPRAPVQTRAKTKTAARSADQRAAATTQITVTQPVVAASAVSTQGPDAVHRAIDASTPLTDSSPVEPGQTKKYRIKVVTYQGTHEFLVRPSTQAGKILAAVADKLATCSNNLRFIFVGKYVHCELTFAEQGIEFDPEDIEENTFEVHIEQTGGKPVIYLMSPTVLSATVDLSLVPEWSFSAIYPVAPVARKGALESIVWDVDVRPNGSLFDKRSASEVAYLYWEATTNAGRPLSPPSDERIPPAFNPVLAALTPSEAVVLDVEDIPAYLDKALKAMTLHTEARTSFITYWLPSILRHKHIALRFLPQAEYEHAAPMRVAPAPDVVTRVFMLFRGVAAEEVNRWQGQRAPEEWACVVGVDCAQASNASLFRVLEWGGMEVKS